MQKKKEIIQIFKTRSFYKQTFCDMAAISKPMLNKFGFSAFVYVRLYDDDTCLTLHTDHRIAKYLIQNEVHISAHVPKKNINDEFWFIVDPNGTYSQHIRAFKELTSSSGLLNYIRRFHGHYEMFSFLAPGEQSSSANIFMNNKELLENYSSEFVAQANKLILSVDLDRFRITEIMKPNFRGLQSNERINSIHLQVYLDRIQRIFMRLNPYNSPSFSPQQLKCLAFLTQGKTALDMAHQLKISIRTVEMHLNIIKEKIGCRKKSDIIGALINLHERYN